MKTLEELNDKYQKYLDKDSEKYDKSLREAFEQLVKQAIAVARTPNKNTNAYVASLKSYQDNFKNFEKECKNHQKVMNTEAKKILTQMKSDGHAKYQDFKDYKGKDITAKQLETLKTAAGIQPAPSGGALKDIHHFKQQNQTSRSGYGLDSKSVNQIINNPEKINLGYLNESINELAKTMKSNVDAHHNSEHQKSVLKNK